MRQIVEPRDIEKYWGKSRQASYKLMQKIRKDLGKKARQPINVREFAEYHNFNQADIQQFINNMDQKKHELQSHESTTPTSITKTPISKSEYQPYRFTKNIK